MPCASRRRGVAIVSPPIGTRGAVESDIRHLCVYVFTTFEFTYIYQGQGGTILVCPRFTQLAPQNDLAGIGRDSARMVYISIFESGRGFTPSEPRNHEVERLFQVAPLPSGL